LPGLITHLVAVTTALAIFLILGLSYYGWGRVLVKILRVKETPSGNHLRPIWLGWALTLVFFEGLHFFLPLQYYVVIPVFLIGIAVSIAFANQELKSPFKLAEPFLPDGLITTVFMVTFICTCIWVISRAMLPPTNYDSGIYHFNAIRWINSYPILQGLGNLHGRLGFNQSFFVYAAALNFFPLFNQGRSIANGFLLLVLIGDLFLSLRGLLRKPRLLREHPFYNFPALFILPIVAYIAIADLTDGLASPTPDMASTLLQFAIFLELARGIAEWQMSQREQDYRALTIIILSATAITIKLSNLIFALVCISMVLAYAWKSSHPALSDIGRLSLPMLVVFTVWGARGYFLSGAPFFPSTIGYIPLAWAVPKFAVINEANVTLGWARATTTNWGEVLGNWNWLGPWLKNMFSTPRFIGEMIYPLSIFLLFIGVDIIVACIFLWRRRRVHYLDWIVLLPGIFGLIYWFFSAPAPRFANAVFWILPICAALILLALLRSIITNKHTYRRLFWAVFLLTNLFPISYLPISTILAENPIFAEHNILHVSLSGWYPVKSIHLVEHITDFGLAVYTPAEGEDQCWDSPLPCSPNYSPSLRLRKPGDLASGFICDNITGCGSE
jgi:hypothetical protein